MIVERRDKCVYLELETNFSVRICGLFWLKVVTQPVFNTSLDKLLDQSNHVLMYLSEFLYTWKYERTRNIIVLSIIAIVNEE